MKKLTDFEVGYIMACANIVNSHGEETIAADALGELGVSWASIKDYGFCEYDMQALINIKENYKQVFIDV